MKLTLALCYALSALVIQNDARASPRIMPMVKAKSGSLSAINGQIVGGTLATAGQLPYQVHLLIDRSILCGGSLISSRWILTAAHCLYNQKSVVVRMGTLNWRLATETNRVTMTSTTIVVHAQYDDQNVFNDVALLKLPSAAPMNNFISTIALPKYSDVAKTYAGFTGTASGWGWNNDNGTASNNLMWVNMAVIGNNVCKETFGSVIISSTICTSGAGSKSTCRGDSGGPLVVVDGNKKLIGVVSFGAESCESGFPQAYARVTSFLTWINQNTGIVIRS